MAQQTHDVGLVMHHAFGALRQVCLRKLLDGDLKTSPMTSIHLCVAALADDLVQLDIFPRNSQVPDLLLDGPSPFLFEKTGKIQPVRLKLSLQIRPMRLGHLVEGMSVLGQRLGQILEVFLGILLVFCQRFGRVQSVLGNLRLTHGSFGKAARLQLQRQGEIVEALGQALRNHLELGPVPFRL
eukprot:scaffold754_cov289-Pavlova_lutheri.AAC.8